MINSKDISVIVQGAIDKKTTSKCLKSIRKYLPDAEIILSTWEGSDVTNLDYDIVLLNQDPGAAIFDFVNDTNNNFNRQLVSTKTALKKVKRKYCLKLRTDLTLDNSKILDYWDRFEVQKQEYKIFKHRIIGSSVYAREKANLKVGNGLPTPFHPSDFWFFGLTDDLKDYFCDCPMQTPKEAGDWQFKYPNRLPYFSMLWRYAPEQFFCVNWVKKYYPNLQFEDWSDWNQENIELSNNILYNNFIFLDYEQSGIYTKKHKWALGNKDKIQGLITYQHFQEQYQHYCDKSYKPEKRRKDYKYKLNQHFKRLIQPFCKIKSWISEMFSVIYYAFAVAITGGRKNND